MEITKEGISKYIEDYGVAEALRGFSELVDKRVYFKISHKGIERKNLNMAFPAVAFLGDKDLEKTCTAIYESIDPIERQHIVKIDRMSNSSIEKLKEKFGKLIIKESKEHALNYGKELLLRDEKEFYNLLSEIILMDSMKNMKALMLSSFKKLGRKDDEFIFLLISYITKARADYSLYEAKQLELSKKLKGDYNYKEVIDKCTDNLKNIISKNKGKETVEVLEVAAYLKLLSENINDENKDRYGVFFEIIKDRLEKLTGDSEGLGRELTEIEESILSVIF